MAGLIDRWRRAALRREDDTGTGGLGRPLRLARDLCALAMAAFLFWTAGFGELTATVQRAFPMLLAGVMIFIVFPSRWRWLDAGWAAATVFSVGYLILFNEEIAERIGWETTLDYAVGVIGTIVVIELARRTTGWSLPIIAGVFLVYDLFGGSLPGILGHPSLSLGRVVRYTWLSQEGIFGLALGAVASFVYLYILFSSLLAATGAGKVFTDLAYALTGRMRSGPAQTAVVSSLLFGSINGSSAANVVGTGTFTIPLMKRLGYAPAFAGAVEATASTGGQIMPPIMGAAAFVMAEVMGVPYAAVAAAALIPALLYYAAVAAAVHFEALRIGVRGGRGEELPSLRATLKISVPFFTSTSVLIGVLLGGYSTGIAGFWAIVALLAACLVERDLRRRLLPIVWKGICDAGVASLQIWAAVALVGVVMASVTMTGLGPHFAELVSRFAEWSLLLALFFTMLASLVLGMGLPTVACYLLLAILVVPALLKLGVPMMAAHMFVLYFGAMSSVTPPVAIAAFAAAGLAGASAVRIGWIATRLAFPGFLVPYLFVTSPVLLMIEGTPLEIASAAVSALVGSIMLAGAMIGYMAGPLGPVLRGVLFAGAIGLLVPGWQTDLAGLAALAFTLAVQGRRRQAAAPAPS